MQPEAFQAFQTSSPSSKLGGSEGPGGTAAPRAEDSRGGATPLGLALPALEPPPSEDCVPEQTEEQGDEEGNYDCTLS